MTARPERGVILSKGAGRKITLRAKLVGSRPEVWRELQVPVNATLHQLHMILQIAMDWNDLFRYCFSIDGETYTTEEYLPDKPTKSSINTQLSQMPLQRGDSFTYIYDLEECWKIDLEVAGSAALQRDEPPACTAGQYFSSTDETGRTKAFGNLQQNLSDLIEAAQKDPSAADDQPSSLDTEGINVLIKWYWEHRDPQEVDWSISRICSSFLEDIEGETTQLTWRRCQQNLASLMHFIDVTGPALYPVDLYLLEQRGLELTDTTGLRLMLDCLDLYFTFYLVWRRTSSPAGIRDNKATLQRLVKWLHGIDVMGEEPALVFRLLIEACSDQAQKDLLENWRDIEHPEVDLSEAETIREGFLVAEIGHGCLSLMGIDTMSLLENINCPADVIARLDEDMPVGAEIAITPDDTKYLTGVLLLSDLPYEEQFQGQPEREGPGIADSNSPPQKG